MSELSNVRTDTPLPIMYHQTSELQLSSLQPHPLNRPATGISQPHVETLMALIQHNGYNGSQPLTVRPYGEGYQIIEGHHRVIAAGKLGYTQLPCVVEELDDVETNLRLLMSNEQEGNHALDVGLNAIETIEKANGGRGIHAELGVRGYARRIGKDHAYVIRTMQAAEVYKLVSHDTSLDVSGIVRQLIEIHVAPEWLWEELVVKVVDDKLTVERTRELVRPLKEVEAPPAWSDQGEIAALLVRGNLRPREVEEFATIVEGCVARLTKNEEDTDRLIVQLYAQLAQYAHTMPSDVWSTCNAIEEEQRALIKERQQADMFRQKREEQVRARTARLRQAVSLEEWGKLAEDEQHALLHLSTQDVPVGQFNKQENTAIEWAQYSWNPVTGCLHNCPYCYARTDALKSRMQKIYPYGFAPTLHPARLLMPGAMTIPPEAATDSRYKNVFTCSMADLFGRWVPATWIESVLTTIREASQWHFLCLTKFPKRLIEFALPANAWMGTTVDLQARVKAAEDAFAHITQGIRWLSIEPLLEPLRFQHLERFDWMVIGGASGSDATPDSPKTPEWRPPHAWIKDLERQADDAGVKVYYKTNLLGKRRLELPFNAVLPDDTEGADAVFHYLKTPGSANGLE